MRHAFSLSPLAAIIQIIPFEWQCGSCMTQPCGWADKQDVRVHKNLQMGIKMYVRVRAGLLVSL